MPLSVTHLYQILEIIDNNLDTEVNPELWGALHETLKEELQKMIAKEKVYQALEQEASKGELTFSFEELDLLDEALDRAIEQDWGMSEPLKWLSQKVNVALLQKMRERRREVEMMQ